MSKSKHIIHRVNLEIEAPTERIAKRVQDEAVLLLKNEILPRLERMLDELAPEAEFVQMNQLTLDVNSLRDSQFESSFGPLVMESFLVNFEKRISQLSQAKTSDMKGEEEIEGEEEMVTRYSGRQVIFESFIFFLEYGTLPWWCSRDEMEGPREEVLLEPTFFSSLEQLYRLLKLLYENKTAMKRLQLQYSQTLILRIVEAYQQDRSHSLDSKNLSIVVQDLLSGVDKILPSYREKEFKISSGHPPQDVVYEKFLFFLESGILPEKRSQGDVQYPDERALVEHSFFSSYSLLHRLLEILRENNAAMNRLLTQYSDDFILRIIAAHLNRDPSTIREELQRSFEQVISFKRYSSACIDRLRHELPGSVLKHIVQIEGSIDTHRWKALLDEVIRTVLNQIENEPEVHNKRGVSDSAPATQHKGNSFQEIKKEPSRAKRKRPKEEEEGIFVQQAGLVLLHPFLEYYFKDFDLLEDKNFKGVESATTAIHLLHFLATGEESASEFEMTFEKYICGIDMSEPIAKQVLLTDAMKDESNKLLNAAIKHWSALKNTSPDGLRDGFLQREGKLIVTDFQDRLIIENKAQDALLTFLPWGFSIIKLPWMKRALYVEWQT